MNSRINETAERTNQMEERMVKISEIEWGKMKAVREISETFGTMLNAPP